IQSFADSENSPIQFFATKCTKIITKGLKSVEKWKKNCKVPDKALILCLPLVSICPGCGLGSNLELNTYGQKTFWKKTGHDTTFS
ncbi:MAG: hypothetical protein J7M30_11065, partial [Deltaproteobacteria bacterium]|nr:hypothetical protein [Deltaproteobacteria bacterium]